MKKLILALLFVAGCDIPGQLGYKCYGNYTCEPTLVCVRWNKYIQVDGKNKTETESICVDDHSLMLGEPGQYIIIRNEKLYRNLSE